MLSACRAGSQADAGSDEETGAPQEIMIGPNGGAVAFVIAYMLAAVLLAVMLVAGVGLVAFGSLSRRNKARRAGLIVLAVWFVPAAVWGYYWLVFTERDAYRTLSKAEVVYGVPLPAGAQVNFRKWARKTQWATLPAPQTIQGVDYTVQVNFCAGHVCSGTLARDQDIQGLPCRAHADAVFSPTTGRLTQCTLARPFFQQVATWPAGTIVEVGSESHRTYTPPKDAAPIAIGKLLVHSGLIVQCTPEGHISELEINYSQPEPDTRLEVGELALDLPKDANHRYAYHFEPDGTIQGGVLARPAVINGKSLKAGEPVTVPAGKDR